ncbi:MAG: cupin domain-containing protein [Caldilineaceae bacterium]
MSFEVYDYRTTNRNVLVTPEIRARLYHMKPGQVDGRHTHDLGHEVFLILEGRAEFEIKGERRVLGPGEMCIAKADEIHQVRNALPDQPTIMYLSVSPHILPTHTYWTNDGWSEDSQKLPPSFSSARSYSGEDDVTTSTEALLERNLTAVAALDQAVTTNTETQSILAAAYREAIAKGDKEAAIQARNAMWQAMYTVYKAMSNWGSAWNEFAARTVEEL